MVLKLLSLESVVLARRRNAVDAIPLVTTLYPISVARAQSTFLTASEKARQVIGYCCLVSLSRDFSGQYYPPLQG